jgi:hypothetical protein
MKLALPAGLSPATSAFEARRSNTLSYGSVETEEEAEGRSFIRRAGHARLLMNFSIRVPPPKWPASRSPHVQTSKPASALRASAGSLHPPLRSGRRLVGRHGADLNAVRKHLCGLRDRCIAAMLATLVAVRKDRDAKAELNRRSQVCDVLTDTGISRRVKEIPSAPNPAPGHYFDRAWSLPAGQIHLGNGRA